MARNGYWLRPSLKGEEFPAHLCRRAIVVRAQAFGIAFGNGNGIALATDQTQFVRRERRRAAMTEQRQQHWIEFLYVSLIGWAWLAASLVAAYFLFSAVFFGGGWWRVVASVAVAWFLYKVTLYYQLERSRG
jgi:hypothetical protein